MAFLDFGSRYIAGKLIHVRYDMDSQMWVLEEDRIEIARGSDLEKMEHSIRTMAGYPDD